MALKLIVLSDDARVDPMTGVVEATREGKVSGLVVADYSVELGKQLPALVAGEPPVPGTTEAGKTAPVTLVFDVRLLAACPVEGTRRLARMRSGSIPSSNAKLEELRLGWAAQGSRCLDESGPKLGGCLDSWAFDALHQKLLHQAPEDEPVIPTGKAADASAGATGATTGPPGLGPRSTYMAGRREGEASSASAAAPPPCGCSRSDCTSTLCRLDVPISALGYSMGRPARQGDVLGCALDVGGQALEFFLTGDSLEQAFKRVGHDSRRGAGRALVPAVSFEATIPAGASRELFQVRVGGPDAAGQDPILGHSGCTAAGWVNQLRAVADAHDKLVALESEAGGFVMAGEPTAPGDSAPAAVPGTGDVAPAAAAAAKEGGGAATVDDAAGAGAAAAAAAAASSGKTGEADALDESAAIMAEMIEPELDSLEQTMASNCWSEICKESLSDEDTKGTVLRFVFGIMAGAKTILLGRPHPIEGETDTVVPPDRRGEGMLHAAASAGKALTLAALLECAGGAVSVDARSIKGDRATPLHRAAAAGHEAAVVALLGAGATCTIKNATGCTALDLARQGHHTSIVHLLSDAMGLPSVSESGLQWACASGDAAAIAKELAAHPDQAATPGPDGKTPLQAALDNGSAAETPGILGAFARAAPSTLNVLGKPGEPLAHTLLAMCKSPLTGAQWDMANSAASGGSLSLGDGNTAVTCNATNAVIPLTHGLGGPGSLSFTVRLVEDKLKDEATVFGFVRNRPAAASYKDAEHEKHSIFVRAYNGDVYGPKGSEVNVAKVDPIHPGEEVTICCQVSHDGNATFSVATEASGKVLRVVRSGVKCRSGDAFYPAVAFYRSGGQVVKLVTQAWSQGANSSLGWPLCSTSDATRFATAIKDARCDKGGAAPALAAEVDWSAAGAQTSAGAAAATCAAEPPTPPPQRAPGSAEAELQTSPCDLLMALVAGGIPVDEPDSRGRSVLHVLAEQGMLDADVARLATAKGMDLTKPCKSGRLPLHVAKQGFPTALRVLHGVELKARASVPATTEVPLATFKIGGGGQYCSAGPWEASSVSAGWFDRRGSLRVEGGEVVPVRGIALPAPTAGTLLAAGAAVAMACELPGAGGAGAAAAASSGSASKFGVIAADVEVREGAEALVDWQDGSEPSRVSVAPGSMGLELLHIDLLGRGPEGSKRFAWPEEAEIFEMPLRFRRRGETTDASRISVGMFVTLGPKVRRPDDMGFGWVEAVGDAPDGPVEVRWLGDTVESLSLGTGEGHSAIHVIDVDPTSDACALLVSGSFVTLGSITSFARGEVLCYSLDGDARVGKSLQRERTEAEAAQCMGASEETGGPASVPDDGKPPLAFDPSFAPQPVKCTQGGRAVAVAETGKAVVPVNVKLAGGKLYEIELTSLTGGTDSDETEVGVAILPAAAGEPLSTQWTLTLASGKLHGAGARKSDAGPSVLPGSRLRMRLDLRPGRGTLTFAVDGVEDTMGPAMTRLPTDSSSVLIPVVVLKQPMATVRVESAVELAEAERALDLELREADAQSDCAKCGMRIASPETWVAVDDHIRDMVAWSCAVDVAVGQVQAAQSAGTKVVWYNRQTDQTVSVVEELSIGKVDTETSMVQLLKDDGKVEGLAHPRSLRVISALGHQPLLTSTNGLVRPAPACVCPTCFMTSNAPISIGWEAEPRGGGGDAEAVMRALLESKDDIGDSLLAACVRKSSVAILHAAWQLGALEKSLLRPGSDGRNLLELAMLTVPTSSADADQTTAWAGEGSDASARDGESEDDVVVRSFLKQIGGMASRRIAQRVIALGSLQQDSSSSSSSSSGAVPLSFLSDSGHTAVLRPWLCGAEPLAEPQVTHALVVLPANGPSALAEAAVASQGGAAGGLVAWVRLSSLRSRHRLAKLASDGVDSTDSSCTEVLTPELWHQLGGVDLLGHSTSPAMDSAWLLFGLMRRLARSAEGSGPAATSSDLCEPPPPAVAEAERALASANAQAAASQLLQMSILSQLSERERVLVSVGAQIEDNADALGRTPLHIVCAAPLPSPDMVQRLVSRGAKTMATDHSASTPLHSASRCSEGGLAVEIMKILLVPLLEPSDSTASGAGAAAASSGEGVPIPHEQQLLKRLGASPAILAAVNTRDGSGRRPLHFTARCGCWDSTVFLLACGASLEDDEDAASPLYSAVSSGHRHIVSLLCNRGAKVDASHKKTGFTPLHVAVTRRSQSMVALLLRAGASPDYPSSDGVTPLSLARRLQAHNLVGIIHDAMSTRAERSTGAGPVGAAAQLAALVGKHLISPKTVRLGRKLGEGGFGVVMEAELEHMPGTKVVVKQLKTVTALDDTHREMLLQEVKLMRLACSIHHPAVLQFIGLIAEDHGVSSNGRPLAYGLVLDFAAGGSLRDLLDSTADPITLPLTSRLALLCDIASGLAFLHAEQHTRQPIAHRDLKPDNILLDQSRTRAMISDFGLSKVRNVAEQATKTSKFATTMHYRAPEVWASRKARRQRRDQRRGVMVPLTPTRSAEEKSLDLQNQLAQDLFSFGVLMWETVTLLAPFGGDLDVMDVSRCIVTERRLPGPLEDRLEEEAAAAVASAEDEQGQAEDGRAAADCELGGRDWTDLAWFEGTSAAHPPQAGLQTTQSAGGGNTGASSAEGADFEMAYAGDGGFSDDIDDDQYTEKDYEAASAMPRSLALLIARCCSYDPTQRPKATEVITELSRITAAVRLQIHGVEATPQAPEAKVGAKNDYDEF